MGINNDLGFPIQKMKKIIIAFDVDGTLISNESDSRQIIANENIRNLLIILSKFKNTHIIVWSGSGETWARQAVMRMGIEKYVDRIMAKDIELNPDIAIDDIQDTALGILNLIVREK